MKQAVVQKYIEKKIGGNPLESSQTELEVNKNKGGIDWSDFNFPPCLNVIHFSLSELKDPQKKVVRLMYIVYWLVLSLQLLNILNNIVMTEKYEGIRVFYSFLNFFIFPSVQLYVMYRGYQGMCYDSSYLGLYRVMQTILVILYFIFSILSAGPFNGFARMGELDDYSMKTALTFSIFESLGYLGTTGLAVWTIYQSIIEDKLETSRL